MLEKNWGESCKMAMLLLSTVVNQSIYIYIYIVKTLHTRVNVKPLSLANLMANSRPIRQKLTAYGRSRTS